MLMANSFLSQPSHLFQELSNNVVDDIGNSVSKFGDIIDDFLDPDGEVKLQRMFDIAEFLTESALGFDDNTTLLFDLQNTTKSNLDSIDIALGDWNQTQEWSVFEDNIFCNKYDINCTFIIDIRDSLEINKNMSMFILKYAQM